MLNFMRKLHVGRIAFASLEQSNLAKLRKKTGYTFANCKKALEMHSNDIVKAENWLNDQAQALGWSKANKLAGRATTNGLVALKYDDRHAALVEINCETDFVARNEKFRAMAEEAAEACFKFSQMGQSAEGPVTKMLLDGERLGGLHGLEGKKLSDRLALAIGALGENAVLRRAECWRAAPGYLLAGYTHPTTSPSVSHLSTGKYAAILAYACENPGPEADEVSRQLCQHVVGMNPPKIGADGVDEPAPNADDEKCLIYQEFVANPEMRVDDVLKEHRMRVVDFTRFECGQSLEENVQQGEGAAGQPLEHIQTCQ